MLTRGFKRRSYCSNILYLSKIYIIKKQLVTVHDVIALPRLPSKVGKSNPQAGFRTLPGSAGFHQGGWDAR